MPVGFQTGLRLVDWVLSGASVDLDFANNRFFGSLGGSLTSYLSISRASIANAKNGTGAWVQFPANTLRITDLGLLIEDARINYLLQSETPATQTTASLGTGSYTLWVEGSGSALASGGSATLSGAASATAGSPNTFSVTVAGTVVVTVTGSLTRFQLENGSFASSYIPTTGTTASRAADAISCSGSLLTIFSSLPHSVVADAIMNASPTLMGYPRIVGNSSPDDRALIVAADGAGGSNTIVSAYYVGINLQATLGSSKTWTGGVKAGTAQASGDRAVVGGGGTVATDTNVVAMAFPVLGYTTSGGNMMYGYIRRLTAWNFRLANATLQGFTL